MHRVFILEDYNGNYEVFREVDVARDFAYKKLIEWGYNPDNDKTEAFKELDETYKDERYAGFWIDELLWCYEANYHY